MVSFLNFPETLLANSETNFCPNFEFTRNMQVGTKGRDVYVLQKILNLDSRTQIAKSGVGSKGQETNIFGEKTRISLKRFQALFIEYTEVADGKFNTQTRSLINNICTGPYFTGGSGDVFSLNKLDPNDKTGPIITLSGPETMYKDETIRVNIAGTESVLQPNLNSLILEGATASDVRKISPSSYSVAIQANEDNTTGQINIQIEASTISDLNGNKNETASNELLIEVTELVASTSSSTITSGSLDLSVLNDILKTLPSATTSDCSTVKAVSVYDYANPCYGKAPTVNPITSGQSASPKSNIQELIQPMLTGLVAAYGLVKLTGGLGEILKKLGLNGSGVGISDAGGYGSIPGKCNCPGEFFNFPTIGLYKAGGSPIGRYLSKANLIPGQGPFVGKLIESPVLVCGVSYDPKTKTCYKPTFDSTDTFPVLGIIPAPPIFMWTK